MGIEPIPSAWKADLLTVTTWMQKWIELLLGGAIATIHSKYLNLSYTKDVGHSLVY